MENNHDLQAAKNSSGEATIFEESPQYLLTDIADSLLNGRPLPYYAPASSDDVPAPRTRVLFFTGRKLSQNLVRDFNALAAQAPEKNSGLHTMISAIQTLPNIWHSYHLTVPACH